KGSCHGPNRHRELGCRTGYRTGWGNLRLPLQALADAQSRLCGGRVARGHPWGAPRPHCCQSWHDPEQRHSPHSSGSPGVEEALGGNVPDVPCARLPRLPLRRGKTHPSATWSSAVVTVSKVRNILDASATTRTK